MSSFDDPFSPIPLAMMSGDGAFMPEPQMPEPFSPLDLRDRVVIMLLFKQAVALEVVEAAWYRWQQRKGQRDAGPLWRELLVSGAIDRAFLFQEVADIYAFDRVTVSADDAEAFLRQCTSAFTDDQWRLLWKHKLIPVACDDADYRKPSRLVFATHDPTNTAVRSVMEALHIKAYTIGYAPEAWVESRLKNVAPDYGWSELELPQWEVAQRIVPDVPFVPKSKPALSDIGLPAFAEEALRESMTVDDGVLLWTGPPQTGIEAVFEAMLHEAVQQEQTVVLLNRVSSIQAAQVQTLNLDVQHADALEQIAAVKPDVVYLGSVLHPHEARLAYALATTGHRVWAQMYKADTIRALAHLHHLGVDPQDLSEATAAVFGHRHVRPLCPTCKQADFEPDPRLLAQMGWSRQESEAVVFFERGHDAACTTCSGEGYVGSTALVETLPMEDGIREALRQGPKPLDEVKLWNRAMQGRMMPFQEAAYQVLLAGTCALEDVAEALF